MFTEKKITLLVFLCLIIIPTMAQEKLKKYELDGYLSNMQSVQFEDIHGVWVNDNLIHNRLNFDWYPNDNLTFKMGLRNRIFTGESVKLVPNYGDFISASELGFMDLSWNVISEQSLILKINIDRLYFKNVKKNIIANLFMQPII